MIAETLRQSPRREIEIEYNIYPHGYVYEYVWVWRDSRDINYPRHINHISREIGEYLQNL